MRPVGAELPPSGSGVSPIIPHARMSIACESCHGSCHGSCHRWGGDVAPYPLPRVRPHLTYLTCHSASSHRACDKARWLLASLYGIGSMREYTNEAHRPPTARLRWSDVRSSARMSPARAP